MQALLIELVRDELLDKKELPSAEFKSFNDLERVSGIEVEPDEVDDFHCVLTIRLILDAASEAPRQVLMARCFWPSATAV